MVRNRSTLLLLRASSTGGLMSAAFDGPARSASFETVRCAGCGDGARCVYAAVGDRGSVRRAGRLRDRTGRDRGCLAAVVVVFAGDVQAAQADLALGAVGRRVGDPEADRDRVAVVRESQLSSLLVRIARSPCLCAQRGSSNAFWRTRTVAARGQAGAACARFESHAVSSTSASPPRNREPKADLAVVLGMHVGDRELVIGQRDGVADRRSRALAVGGDRSRQRNCALRACWYRSPSRPRSAPAHGAIPGIRLVPSCSPSQRRRPAPTRPAQPRSPGN